MAEGDETAFELVLFSCDSCYVYMVLPPVQGFPCVGGHSAAQPLESVGERRRCLRRVAAPATVRRTGTWSSGCRR